MRKIYKEVAFKDNMELTKTELKVLSQLAKGIENIKEIAVALSKSKSQIYRTIETLESKGFIEKRRSKIFPKREVHVSLLLKNLKLSSSLADMLSYSGLRILETLKEAKDISQISLETKLTNAPIYRKLNRAISISLIRKVNGKFEINTAVWPEFKDFILSLLKYEQTIDKRVPAEATIYARDDKEVIYSTENEQDAAKTAFSAFEKYKLKILTPENFYYLPNRNLSIKEIFRHSLVIAEKRNEYRYFLYTALFYVKFRKKLGNIKSPVLNNIKIILKGKRIEGYPPLSEIKEKAEQYDIKI